MVPRITVQKNTRVERSIQPPMPMVITLPVLVDDRDSGVALYVTASAFATPPATVQGLKAIANHVADRLNGVDVRNHKVTADDARAQILPALTGSLVKHNAQSLGPANVGYLLALRAQAFGWIERIDAEIARLTQPFDVDAFVEKGGKS